MVDLYSPEKVSDQAINFVYALGNEQISGQANCSNNADDRTWTTLDDGVVHTPESPGSRNMLAVVCGYSTLSAPESNDEFTTLVPLLSAEAGPSESSEPLSNVGAEELAAASSAEEDLASAIPSEGVAIASETEDLAPSSNADEATQMALVFDPPSNVRATPGGSILCSVDASTYINIYGNSGSWYETDACGEMGVIDISQIQF